VIDKFDIARKCRERADEYLARATSAASLRESRYFLKLMEALLRIASRLERADAAPSARVA
jgi:hypothetical protein